MFGIFVNSIRSLILTGCSSMAIFTIQDYGRLTRIHWVAGVGDTRWQKISDEKIPRDFYPLFVGGTGLH